MTKVIMPVPSRDEVRRGILHVLAAVFIFAVINAVVKWEAATYPVTEIVLFRCFFALIFCLGLVAAQGGLRLLRTHRLPEHIGRGTTQFVSMICIYVAFHLMPLADAVAITFSSPLFLTVLSIPLLGEQVGRHRWAAVLVGFAGVLIMVPPGAGVLSVGALLALTNAVLNASVTIALRRMSLSETSATLVTYQAAVTTVLSLLCLPFGWRTPTWQDGLILAGIGLCSGIGQFLWTQGFRFAPAAVLAPFNYTTMIWAIGFGYLMWGDLPTLPLLAGAAVVVASGLYILYRETIRHPARPPRLATAAGDD